MSLTRSQYWHHSPTQANLKHVAHWQVDRQTVLGLWRGRVASWSSNRVALWADLTDASVEQRRRSAGVAPFWAPQGPSVFVPCWKWVRCKSTVESNWRVCAQQTSKTMRRLNSGACVEWAGRDLVENFWCRDDYQYCGQDQIFSWLLLQAVLLLAELSQKTTSLLNADFWLAILGFIHLLLVLILTMWLPLVMWLPSKARDNRKNPNLN